MPANSLVFIVDADIARASGYSEHPVSSHSRGFLEALKDNGHSVALCSVLREEWSSHKSLYATRWLNSMIARKRVIFREPGSRVSSYLEGNWPDCKSYQVAVKDAHLVDAALCNNRVIASNDNTARDVFCNLSEELGVLKSVAWFNAISDYDNLVEYMQRLVIIPNRVYLSF